MDVRPAVTLTRHGHTKCQRVLAQEYMEIPPRSQGNVTARITLLSTSEPPEDSIVEARQLKPGLYVGRTLLPKRHRDVKVTVANTTNKPHLISPGNSLGQVSCVTVLPEKTGSIESADCHEPALDIIKLPQDLTSEQRQQVIDLLRDYQDVFSKGTFDTEQHRPIRQALRRHPRAHLDD